MIENTPQTPTATPSTPGQPVLTEQHISFLMQEIERMQTLYLQTQSGAQGVFNFYLTLITTVFGAVLVMLQVTPLNMDDVPTSLTLLGILSFIALVGLIYLSSISGRYGDMTRFARAVDILRQYLITELQVPVPSLYDTFIGADPVQAEKLPGYVWLLPSGSYGFFIAIVNSMALVGVILLLAGIGNASLGQTAFAAVVMFIVTFVIQNAFSHLMIRVPNRSLSVRIDTSRSLAFSSGRQ